MAKAPELHTPEFYTIEAGTPFVDALAQGLLDRAGDDPAALAAMRVLLPTRRACRALRDTFLRIGGGRPLLLPRLTPLGDADEDELEIGEGPGLPPGTPPALPPQRRLLLLARLVMGLPAYESAPDRALALAESLGRLMDQIHTEGLSFSALAGLVPGDYARHWQITVDFLSILSERWPLILAENGVIDTADRRNRVIRALAARWRDLPPPGPVIAAGSTGSIPATADLLHTVACLPQGCVVLPGLDRGMDDDNWAAIGETHPQATLKHLLGLCGADRRAVRDWPHGPVPASPAADEPPALAAKKLEMRRWLAREAMRPEATAGAWRALKDTLGGDSHALLQKSLQQITRLDCDTQQEEAAAIAVLLRETLETPGLRAALVTPDRGLARRVAACCRRWNIEIDDSAGRTLAGSRAGAFLRLCAAAALDGFRPAALLAALRHGLCAADRDLANRLELSVLRGPYTGSGFSFIYQKLDTDAPGDKLLHSFVQKLESAFSAFPGPGEKRDFAAWLDAHIAAAETLAGGPDRLWTGEDGETAASFFAELRENAALLPGMELSAYLAALTRLMEGAAVRPAFGAHPRLAILGQLEARMVQADITILGGLNEGVWPPAPAADPWMSRPMRAGFGLPPAERGTGLAAHDFVQGFCAPRVVLTRSRRVDGAPAVPSRWLQRLDAVLEALDLAPWPENAAPPCLGFARLLDRAPGPPRPAARPAPVPPPEKRPGGLYVTAIEQWMRDPYSIYARHILKLKRLDDLEQEADAALRGNILHAALEQFVRENGDRLPDDAEAALLRAGRAAFGARLEDPRLWAFWWPRFERLAAWFAAHEREWRKTARPALLEAKGETAISHARGTFVLKAKADRVDILNDGRGAVIDYKTGTTPSKVEVESGLAPQLPLEAVILQDGGFEGLAAREPGYIGFWKLSGGQEPGREEQVKIADLPALAAQAREGLAGLAALFADGATPYYSLPRPDRAPPAARQIYAHLARVQEWAALGDSEEAA